MDESRYSTQAEMDAEDREEYYRLIAWLRENREETRLAGENCIEWAIRCMVTPERKLAEIRAIAANNHIGGMSVPMSQRLMRIIDGPT